MIYTSRRARSSGILSIAIGCMLIPSSIRLGAPHDAAVVLLVALLLILLGALSLRRETIDALEDRLVYRAYSFGLPITRAFVYERIRSVEADRGRIILIMDQGSRYALEMALAETDLHELLQTISLKIRPSG
jgi:hypothetical protein